MTALATVINWLPDFWNGWSTQFLVLLSLALQVLLLLLAGVRRHTHKGIRIWILWVAYQLADYTATYALGNLGASSTRREHQLVAFWVPFLLLHLGGPDNIAAYELEDNKLWGRHILTLGVQALGAGYVLYRHVSGGGWTSFSLVATFMAGVGFVKSCEKTLALRRASLSIIRDSVRKETPAKCTFFLEYEPPRRGHKGDTAQEEEFFKHHAHALFHVCKSAMVDSSVDDDDPGRRNLGGPGRLLRGFTEKGERYLGFKDQDMTYKWTLMEMELSLMYDILYTKAAVVHTLPGYCIRAASSLALAAWVLLFRFSSSKAGLSRVDVFITYILLAGALLLEMTSLLSALFSTWTFAFLCTTRWSRLRHGVLCSGWWDQFRRVVVSLHRLAYLTGIAGFFRISRRWHGTMGQCSMLDMCARQGTARPLGGRWAWASKMLGSSSVWTANVPDMVRKQVVDYIKGIKKDRGMNTLGVIRENWGQAALARHNFKVHKTQLGSELQEAIIMWHIATDILLMEQGKLKTKDTETDVGAIKTISQYMMFLLLKRPAMLPGLAQTKLYQRTEKTLADEWKDAVGNKKSDDTPAALSPATISWVIHRIYTTVMELRDGGPSSDSRLQRREKLAKRLLENKLELDEFGINSRVRFGVSLAEELIKRQREKQDSLQIVLDVWTDILVYAANRCSRESHAKQLSQGGEFTTLIWLMAEHYNQAG